MVDTTALATLEAAGFPVVGTVARIGPFALTRGRVFSEDPHEDRVDEVHIEAWAGERAGGDGAEKPGAVVRYRRVRSGGTVSLEGVPAGLRLSSADVARLIDLVVAAETVLEQPVELGWALADGQIAITAAGPIATPLPWGIERGEPKEKDGWTRTNAGEIFPLPMTPMTWSLMGVPLDGAFGHMYHKPEWTDGRRFVALVNGYVYFNSGC